MRIAAVGDLHTALGDDTKIATDLSGVDQDADILVLAGDITDHGRPVEAEALLSGLREVDVPILAVLGNHDHESGEENELTRLLSAAGVRVLDRDSPTTVVDGVGFAGVKGYGGGFGPHLVRGFGEASLKAFVSASVIEADALRRGLLTLRTRRKVAISHYAPVVETIRGEPPEIWPFLGTSRLETALDEGGADIALHGHAHHGVARGTTAGGVPVHNISLPVLRAAGAERAYGIIDLENDLSSRTPKSVDPRLL